MTEKSGYERLIEATASIIREKGFTGLTRDRIAAEAGTGSTLIYHYFTSLTDLEHAVMRKAVDTGDVALVARGLVVRHPAVDHAGPELRREVVRYLTEQVMGS